MRKILVALDDSEAAREAASRAHDLFGADADYLALAVATSPEATSSVAWGSVYSYPFGATASVEDELARSLTGAVSAARDRASERADAAGLDAGALGAVGDPVHSIARAAHQHDVDVIVVGHEHHNWLRSLFDRSVSGDLLDATDVPVLVVPRPD